MKNISPCVLAVSLAVAISLILSARELTRDYLWGILVRLKLCVIPGQGNCTIFNILDVVLLRRGRCTKEKRKKTNKC